MNHVYRLVWNRSLNALVAVAETAGSGGKASSPRQRRSGRPLSARLAPVAGAVLLALGLAPAAALALPTGGQVVSGHASINQSGSTLTVTQSSNKAILNWQSFGIGKQETVNFDQPGAGSVALNRVLGSSASDIYGHLNANGQLFLVNPNGIYFAPGAQVNVGGLVASTLGISNTAFNNGNYTFSGSSTAGVVNDGTITTTQGGYVAFIGNTVTNNGAIATPGGMTALGAGGTVNLTFAGNRLLTFKVSSATLNALADNGGLIKAEGGTVILSAQARDALLRTVVNNTGVIQAQTVQNNNGTIELLGGTSGTTQVSGTLEASTPNGGAGGTIETSGQHLHIASGAIVNAGTGGQWLIDPVNLVIGTNAATAIDAALNGGTRVTEETTATGTSNTGSTNAGSTSSGVGNITVNAALSWNTRAALTLSAYHSLDINAPITASGGGTLDLVTDNNAGGTSSGGTLNIAAPVNLTTNDTLNINGTGYTIIDSLGSSNSSNSTGGKTLQGIGGSLGGHYALGANINAAATSTNATWKSKGGFTPIGNSTTKFTGTFEGLGHTISNLYINRLGSSEGLFGAVGTNGVVRDVGLVGGSVSDGSNVGALVGYNAGGALTNDFATGSVSGRGDYVGGLVGFNSNATITDAYATGSVSGINYVGGLVGFNHNKGTITDAYATGSVSGSHLVGGLVGSNSSGTITDAYATGSVSGSGSVGGLVGANSSGTITDAYATGSVSGSTNVGGLVGVYGSNTTITDGYWDTTTTGQGTNRGYAYQRGTVNFTTNGGGTTTSGTGGLTTAQLASNLPSGFTTSHWGNGGGKTTPYLLANKSFNTVSGEVYLGSSNASSPTPYGVILDMVQLQNINRTGLSDSYVLGTNLTDTNTNTNTNTSGAGFTPIGNGTTKFTGTFEGLGHTISNLYINRSGSDVGLFGFVGTNGVVRDVGLVGGSVSGSDYVGALVGYNAGTITDAYATGSVSGSGGVGGLVGYNNSYGTITDAYATGSVSGFYGVGGLVGINGSTITDAYATGSVSATGGSTYVGGLVGSNFTNGTITDGYWDSTTTGQSTGVGNNPGTVLIGGNTYTGSSTNGAGGLTSAQMQQGSNFAGFAFTVSTNTTNPWTIYDSHTDPLLSVFLTPLMITAGGTTTYNGQPVSASQVLSYSTPPNSNLLGTATLSDTSMTNAGTYTGVTASGLYSNQQGYLISYASGTVIVDPATLTYTANTATMTYGGSVPALGGTVTGFVNGQTVSSATTGTATYSTTASGTSNVGSYAIDGTGLTANNGNYKFTQATGNATALSIDPAALTITANNATMTYGGSLPTLGVSYNGFVNGDTAASLTQAPTVSSGTASSANAGTYVGTLTASGAVDPNYTMTYVPGALTIDPAALTVSGVTATNKLYDGAKTDNLNTSGASLSGIVGTDSVSLGSGTDAGTFASAQVGQGIAVTAHLSLTGSSVGNYVLVQPTGLTANIEPARSVTSVAGNPSVASNPAERAIQIGYVVPEGGPSVFLSPIQSMQLTTPRHKPPGVTVHTAGGAVSPPGVPCHGATGFNPFAPRGSTALCGGS